MPQIVISDIQVVSPFKIGANDNYRVFRQNENGFVYAPVHEIWENELETFLAGSTHYKRLDRTVQMALLCASHLNISRSDSSISVFMSSSRGATGLWEKSIETFLNSGKASVVTSPLTTLANISSEVSAFLGLRNIALEHSLTCSSGIASVLHAISWLKAGMGQKVLAGASEAPLTEFTMAQVKALGINSPFLPDEFPCRPFNSAGKNTFVLSEASGLAMIEMKDESEILAGEIVVEGIGYSFINPPSLTGIEGSGEVLQRSMRMALSTSCGFVDLVLAHAPGTVKGDKAEWNAVNSVFEKKCPPVYSTKWLTGHSYAASAFLNMAFAEYIFNGGALPGLPYENYVANSLSWSAISRILINVTGFGGNAMSIILSVKK